MSSLELEIIAEHVDILHDVPCDACVSKKLYPVRAATRGLRWDAPGCCFHGGSWLFCDDCPTRGMSGPCDNCGVVGSYVVVL